MTVLKSPKSQLEGTALVPRAITPNESTPPGGHGFRAQSNHSQRKRKPGGLGVSRAEKQSFSVILSEVARSAKRTSNESKHLLFPARTTAVLGILPVPIAS